MLKIEIHPRSGWKMPKSDLIIIDAESGNNSHHYIRNLLEYFLTADELISSGTSNNVFKKHESLKAAITGNLVLWNNYHCKLSTMTINGSVCISIILQYFFRLYSNKIEYINFNSRIYEGG